MALDLSEQLRLVDGTLKPTEETDSLITLTQASGTNFARDFAVNAKDVPPLVDPPVQADVDANAYLNKMLSASNRMITTDSKGNQSLFLVMCSLIAKVPVVTTAMIIGASSDVWEGFVNDNIQVAIELFAGVKNEEKTAYDAL
jgi:hypothetical protein